MKVTRNTLNKLQSFIDSLPEEAKSKCSVCNETLVHLVGSAMAKTGAPQSTVCRCLADDINKTAAPLDKVDGKKLRKKVDYHTKSKKIKKVICRKRANEPVKLIKAIPDTDIGKAIGYIKQAQSLLNQSKTAPGYKTIEDLILAVCGLINDAGEVQRYGDGVETELIDLFTNNLQIWTDPPKAINS